MELVRAAAIAAAAAAASMGQIMPQSAQVPQHRPALDYQGDPNVSAGLSYPAFSEAQASGNPPQPAGSYATPMEEGPAPTVTAPSLSEPS